MLTQFDFSFLRRVLYCVLSLHLSVVMAADNSQIIPNSASSSMGYPSHLVNLNGLTFHYVEKGEGDLIIFLHGYPFFGASWDKLLAHFAREYHVVAPDNRGYNLTAKPKDVNSYKLEVLVEDIKALIHHLPADKKITLVGHDWGGALAWAVAQQYPQLLDKLVVINAPPYNVLLHMLVNNPEQQKSSVYIQRLKSAAMEQTFAKLGPEMLWSYGFDRRYAKGELNEQFKHAFFNAWRQPGSHTAAVNWYRANVPAIKDINDATYWPSKLARVEVPSLLIWTENERTFVPAMLEEIPKYVNELTIKVIAGSGHTPFIDKPNEVIAAMESFLKQHKD